MKILVVEDDLPLCTGVCFELDCSGYLTVAAYTCQKAIQLMESEHFDLALLDVNLPDGNGFDLCRAIKAVHPELPIIFFTANDLESDVLTGFDLGAEDYITKPFDLREVNIRIRAVLRRFQKTLGPEKREQISIPGGQIYENERAVVQDGEPVELTPKEFDLLVWLLKNPRQVFTRTHLLDEIWGYDFMGDTRTVDIHIQRLRKKLYMGRSIITVFGVGYKYVPEE